MIKFYLLRIFWILALTISIYMTVNISLDQWNRYLVNPTVISVETDYRTWEYDHICGVTICSNYTSKTVANEMIEKYMHYYR